jgi:nucleoside-diphosphate-sugar epimerase
MAAVGRAVGRRPRLLRVPPLLVRAALHVTGATAHVLGRATILSPDKAGEFLAAAWTCRSDALAADTGWRAEIPLERGLADTARWYRQQAWL